MIMDEQFDDDWGLHRLREELMLKSHSLIVATAQRRVEQIENGNYPLYGLFRRIYLDNLTIQDLEQLVREKAKWDLKFGNDERVVRFLQQLDEEPHRIKALFHLTNGNPRMALILYHAIVRCELSQLQSSLEDLMNNLTPYFQSQMLALPPKERRVVTCLARTGRAMRPSEIAVSIDKKTAYVSSLLGRLVDKDFIRLAPQREGQAKYYYLNETLLRYWRKWLAHEKDLSLFVEFVASWFHQREIRAARSCRRGRCSGLT